MTADPSSNFGSKPRPKRWKTAFIILGSAAFGGVAFALWNRRELAQIHDQRNAPDDGAVSPEQPEEELI